VRLLHPELTGELYLCCASSLAELPQAAPGDGRALLKVVHGHENIPFTYKIPLTYIITICYIFV
jgi:hypothetical protein